MSNRYSRPRGAVVLPGGAGIALSLEAALEVRRDLAPFLERLSPAQVETHVGTSDFLGAVLAAEGSGGSVPPVPLRDDAEVDRSSWVCAAMASRELGVSVEMVRRLAAHSWRPAGLAEQRKGRAWFIAPEAIESYKRRAA